MLRFKIIAITTLVGASLLSGCPQELDESLDPATIVNRYCDKYEGCAVGARQQCVNDFAFTVIAEDENFSDCALGYRGLLECLQYQDCTRFGAGAFDSTPQSGVCVAEFEYIDEVCASSGGP